MQASLTEKQSAAVEQFSRLRVGAAFMEQGMGKSRVAVELANGNPHVDRVIWLAPFSTLDTIRAEAGKWGLSKPLHLLGYETLSASDSSYLDTLALADSRTLVIADESIFIKNAEAKRTKRAAVIRAQCGFALALNGTPVVRDLWDLKRQVDWLSPKILSMDDRLFRDRYFKQISYRKAGGHKQSFDKIYEPNVAHLLSLIKPYVFEARLQIDVDETAETVRHGVSDEARENYKYARGQVLESAAAMSKALDIKALLIRLAGIAATDTEKCAGVQREIDGRHCLVFGSRITELDKIGEGIDHLRIDGSTPKVERTRIFAEHRSREVPLLMTYGTGAFGLNLQHVSEVNFASPVFDFGRMNQAASRVRRLGQASDIRYVQHVSDLKIDEFVLKNLANKDWLAQLVRGEIDLKEEV